MTNKQTNKQTKRFLILAFSKTINKTVIQYNQCVTQLKYLNLKYIASTQRKILVNLDVSYTFKFYFIFTLNLTSHKFNSFVEYGI